jgi:hypothetical protein
MDKTATAPFIAVVSGELLVAVGAGSGEVSGTGIFRSFLAWRQAEQGGCFLHRGGRAVQGARKLDGTPDERQVARAQLALP